MLPDGIAIGDSSGHLVFMNLAAQRILGIGMVEAPSSEWTKLYGIFLADQITPYPDSELPLVRAIRGEFVNDIELFVRNPMLPEGLWITVNGRPLTIPQHSFSGGIVIFRDITARKQMEFANQQLAAIVDSSSDAIISKNLDGVIQSWNQSAERIFGYRADEIIGKSVTLLIPSDRLKEESEIRTLLSQGQRVDSYETVRQAKDGKLICVSLTVSPIFDRFGKPTGASKIIRDVSERKLADDSLKAAKAELEVKVSELALLNTELSAAKDQAQSASKLKSEFVANMSHEIRTPMNGIIGMCNILLGTNLDARQREYANAVKEASNALLTIINDILDFSKIEAGRLDLEIVEFDPVRLVESTCELVVEQAHKKELSLMSFIDPAIPQCLRGDPERLRQVLINLVSNAVKFSNRGEVVVRAKLESTESNFVHVRFSVTDNGIGLTPEEQNRLFQPFVQADGSICRKFGGTGLGLSISKNLVSLMGGSIGLESVKGAGSTFWFVVRLERRQDNAAPTLTHELRNLGVLIVGSESQSRDIIQTYLDSWGMRACVAGDAKAAMQILRQAYVDGNPFRIAIVDLVLPGESGIDLAASISKDLAVSSTKLILLSAFTVSGLGVQSIDLGFKACLTKPVRQSQLLNCLTEVACGGYATAAVDTLLVKPTVVLAKQGDAAKFLILIAEDNFINQQVAQIYLQEMGLASFVVSNGQQCVEAMARDRYAIVLMDCQMPEMDGFSATNAIRKAELLTGRHTPIIAMTANAMEGDRERCLASGMDDYISKPIDPDQLRNVIQKWVRQ